ncbi:MAG: hypothetical protein U0264_04860 [Candidatus Kapaibacterium sp.]
MKHLLAILLILLASSQFSTAQDSNARRLAQPIQYNNKIGFAGSMFSAYGISYEYDASRDFTFELTGAVFGEGGNTGSSYDNSNSYLTVAIGAEVQRNFINTLDTRFYGFVGIGYWLENNSYTYNNYYSNYKDYTGGLGIGWEMSFFKRFVLNVEGGYVYRDMNRESNDYNGSNYTATIRHTYYLGFGVGAGIYYTF